jgi:DNA-binding winged helix-turn-helix (wHTH) protein
MMHSHAIYDFGHFRLDPTEQVLLCAGKPVRLTLKAFAVLCVLVENNGHLVTKDHLISEVWLDAHVEEGNLSQAICALRRVLGESHRDHQSHEFIQTVARRGYRFIALVDLQNEIS